MIPAIKGMIGFGVLTWAAVGVIAGSVGIPYGDAGQIAAFVVGAVGVGAWAIGSVRS